MSNYVIIINLLISLSNVDEVNESMINIITIMISYIYKITIIDLIMNS